MTRLNHVNPTNADPKAKNLLDGVQKALGATPNMFTAMANSPAALEAYLNFNSALTTGALDPQFREKLALTVAGKNRCTYCASAHTFLGKKAGIADDELAANLNGRSADPMCQAGLDFVSKLVEARGNVSESDVKAVRDAGFSDARIVEMVAHTAINIFTNYFNRAFDTDVDFPEVSATNEK